MGKKLVAAQECKKGVKRIRTKNRCGMCKNLLFAPYRWNCRGCLESVDTWEQDFLEQTQAVPGYVTLGMRINAA